MSLKDNPCAAMQLSMSASMLAQLALGRQPTIVRRQRAAVVQAAS